MDIQKIENHFPQGIARGKAFLGRVNQIKWLKDNIYSNHHTLLLAPRRFGKTSLAINTLDKIKLPYAEIDLYLALSAKSVEKKILRALSNLLKLTADKNEQILQMFQSFFKDKKAKWTLGFKGIIGVELEPDRQEDSPENILTGLKLIDHILIKKKRRAILFIDEFQEIHNLTEGQQIQGAIRNFAQSSKNLVLIFSGSNRQMLNHMFDDKSQPMYELCDRIIVDRIDATTYKKYIDNIAVKTWGDSLTDEAINKIIQLSELHPRRIYNLCYYLWRLYADHNKPPQEKDVLAAWDFFVSQRIKDLRHKLSKKSAGQLKILTLIANGEPRELTGKKAQELTGMASSSIIKALNKLELDDYIERIEENQYRIIDPLVSYMLRKYEKDNLST